MTNNQKELIALEVIKTLASRFESFPENTSKNRNAPFHDAFLKAFATQLQNKVSDVPFFISLSSWLQGLNTTLGQTFFENVAHILCFGEKKEFTSKKLGNLQISHTHRNNIGEIISNLSNGIASAHLEQENVLVLADYEAPFVNSLDFSADVFFEDEDSITAIELKSVKPNSGEMRGEKHKILEGKAALYRKFPGKKINFFIGFPFDPTVNPDIESITSYNKERFIGSIINMSKYFHSDEIKVASELWDFLSGESNTMENILQIINTISTTQFLDKLQFISDASNRVNPAFRLQLQEWLMISELQILDSEEVIQQKIKNDRILSRIYHKNIFDNKATYNRERFNILINNIDS